VSPDNRDEENEALDQVKLTNISAWVARLQGLCGVSYSSEVWGRYGGKVIRADDSIPRRLQTTRPNVFEMAFLDSNARKSVFAGFPMSPLAPADSGLATFGGSSGFESRWKPTHRLSLVKDGGDFTRLSEIMDQTVRSRKDPFIGNEHNRI